MLSEFIIALFICTAYTPSYEECGKTDAITASGVMAEEGVTVACDCLPFGTKIIMDGHEYIVQDRFGGGYKNKLDIFMWDKDKALDFGVQTKAIMIPKEHKDKVVTE